MSSRLPFRQTAWPWLLLVLLLTALVYWPGLYGGWIFDDYPSIVYNQAVHLSQLSWDGLFNAALSSTASTFKRSLASLSFAANYLASGLNPFWMKLSNLLIHLLNGILVFLVTRALLAGISPRGTNVQRTTRKRHGQVAVLVAASWLLLPINLTGVLYVVQRMESMANLFVLLGLLGYMTGRTRMLGQADVSRPRSPASTVRSAELAQHGFWLCSLSLILGTSAGLLAKETAVMLPLYAFLIEWIVFDFGAAANTESARSAPSTERRDGGSRDRRIIGLFVVVLFAPMILGLAWLLPGVFNPDAWAARDFTLSTRLLSEARIVLDYVRWTLFPSAHALSFYHDDFIVSQGWLTPWTTLASALALLALLALAWRVRRRFPLVTLGLTLFFAAQLLTSTILPLELIFEHRNYFASFGLMLALVPTLAAPDNNPLNGQHTQAQDAAITIRPHARTSHTLPHARLRYLMLAALLLAWGMQTALGAYAWGSPVRLARTLAERAPDSPRAQYELGRTYSMYSGYSPTSPWVPMAYAALEKAASMPDSSIQPEQALIYMNARMHLPTKDAWWNSMLVKLRARPSTVEDQAALRTLSICALSHQCALPPDRMVEAFGTALSHPNTGAQLPARYGDYAWNILDDKALGERMLALAVNIDPRQADYRAAWIHMLIVQGRIQEANTALGVLESQNTEGRYDTMIANLRSLLGTQKHTRHYRKRNGGN